MAARHGEAAAGTEVVLDVDNEKRVALADSQVFFQTEILSFSANQRSAASLAKASAINKIGPTRFNSRNGPGARCFQAPNMGRTC